MTKEKFHIKKSQFSVKSRFKESKCADWGHSLNRDFTVQLFSLCAKFTQEKIEQKAKKMAPMMVELP